MDRIGKKGIKGMGMYNSYVGVQLKVGDCTLKDYKLGDEVDIQDGIYLSYEGIVVVKDGKLIAVFEHMIDKWGNKIYLNELVDKILNKNSPVVEAIGKVEKERPAPLEPDYVVEDKNPKNRFKNKRNKSKC